MKTRKIVFTVLTVMLLISAALIAGCIDPENGKADELNVGKDDADVQDGDVSIPAKKGAVRINLGGTDARTILPDFTPFTVDSNNIAGMFFRVIFTPVDNKAGDNPQATITYPSSGYLSYSGFNNVPIVLAVGWYQVLITAYNNNAGNASTIAIAGWGPTAANYDGAYQVTSGVVTTIQGKSSSTPNLIAITDGTTNGSFYYNVSYSSLTSPVYTTPVAYTAKQLIIVDKTSTIVGGPSAGTPIDLDTITGAPTATISLPSGYYTVTVKLTASNCQDREVINAMHIYPGMTSRYAPSPIPAPNQNKFTVKFFTNGVTPGGAGNTYLQDMTGSGGDNYTGRDTQFPINNASALVSSPGDPVNAGYDFGGWWTEGSGGGAVSGTQWTIGTTQVYKDTALYAKWTAKEGMKSIITFDTASQVNINAVTTIIVGGTVSSAPVTLADIVDGVKRITITVTGFDNTTQTWKFDGGTTVGTTGSATLIIDSSSTFLNQLFMNNNVLNVKDDLNNSANITITLTEAP